jgi:hypothetical protein
MHGRGREHTIVTEVVQHVEASNARKDKADGGHTAEKSSKQERAF